MTEPRWVDDLPRIYEPLLPRAFFEPSLRETFATCDRCAMVDRGKSPKRNRRAFLEDRKCCTFFPNLPNYLVGSLLRDGESDPSLAEGCRRVVDRIEQGRADPLGILTPHWYTALYRRFRSTSFGRAKTLLCPYFAPNSGTCTIWRHRDAVCSTFFCKSTSGRAGKEMWGSLRSFLLHLQTSLMLHVMQTLGWSASECVDALERLRTSDDSTTTTEDLDEVPPSPEVYEQLWGSWAGREIEFFREASARVQSLSWVDIESLIGIEGHTLLRAAEQMRQRALHIPGKVRMNASRNVDDSASMVRIDLHPQTDATFHLPVDVLRACHERPPADIIDDVRDQHGLEIDVSLLRTLFQHDWLEDAEDRASADEASR